jgi:lactoylglutathione lyase
MIVSHIAIWTLDTEKSKSFYCTWFEARAGSLYVNEETGFTSYFLEFGDNPCRLELMSTPELINMDPKRIFGLAHFAISTGSKQNVNAITKKLKDFNIEIISEPRTTGDGYYESVIADPDGNFVEITV